MAGFTVGSDEHLIRSELWSKELKSILIDDLNAMKWVRILSDFPDGTTFTIPSVGEAETFDFSEGQAVKYSKMDTGEFSFSFDQYKGSAHAISEKFKRDSFYSSDVISMFVPRQHRALMVAVEARILDRMNAGQTSGNANTINTAAHRLGGSGSGSSIALIDFVKAQHALTKSNVPLTNLVAVVDPSVAYTL